MVYLLSTGKPKYLASEYKAWDAMVQRCTNPKDRRFYQYGAKGIKVCDEWRKSSSAFLEHMGPKPTAKHSLDRIDGKRGYEPGNCRWATSAEQSLNKSSNRLLTHNGVTMTLTEWARKIGLAPVTVRARLDQFGWSVEQALTLAKRRGRKP